MSAFANYQPEANQAQEAPKNEEKASENKETASPQENQNVLGQQIHAQSQSQVQGQSHIMQNNNQGMIIN